MISEKIENKGVNNIDKGGKISFSERFSYGCGDFGCNIIYTAMSAFLLFYYTDYANVSAMAVGTIMMVSRIFDGVSDIHGSYVCVSPLLCPEFFCFLFLHPGLPRRNLYMYSLHTTLFPQ